jgi:hypothetical protein
MVASSDPVTRQVRDAANAAAIAVVAFYALFSVTTQIGSIREVSPFAGDPYDLVASYAATFLPLVAGATWVRSLAHRGPRLPRRIARRIAIGSGLALAIVGASVAADVAAMIATPGWGDDAGSDAGLIVGLVALTAVATLVAGVLLARALTAVRLPASAYFDQQIEPDIVDDALELAVEVGGRVRFERVALRIAYVVGRFLERSPISPRRHRLAFGVALAVASAVAFVVWHAIREGPWASPVAALIFGSLPAVGILAIYLATLAPLRLLRPPLES